VNHPDGAGRIDAAGAALAIVTGTSRGLGAALASRLHQNGAHVMCIGRSFTSRQATLAVSGEMTLVEADLRRVDTDWLTTVLRGAASGAAATLLVANAATAQPVGPVGSVPEEHLVEALRANVEGTVLVTASFLRVFAHQELPRAILHVTSGAARKPHAGWAAYCASKAAVDMFFRCAMLDHPDVAIHQVDPGVVDTDMQRGLRDPTLTGFPVGEALRAFHTEGRLATADEAAQRLLANSVGADWPAGP
jgi:benzil reductase ((S)-benzoin forming)